MPEYTYHCESCGIEFNKYQSFSDAPITICPECSEENLHKVYKPAMIIFKGSGFYATDNKSSSRKNYLNKHPENGETKKDSAENSKPKEKPAEPAPAKKD